MLTYLLQVYVLLTTLISQRVYGKACDAGWFGEDCTFACRCLSTSCSMYSGECPGNGPCRKGYFGPACQFVDLVNEYTETTIPAFLRDSDDNTCNPDPNAVSVQLIQNTTYPFSWFRIVVNNNRNLLNFTTTLNDGQVCSYERKFKVSDTVVDVTCDVIVNLEKLKIDGPIAGNICSVYISGGRNVALRQTTSQVSTFLAAKSGRAVDGDTNRNFNNGSCTHTDTRSQGRPWWHLTLNRPHILYYIRIYNRDDLLHRLKGFILQTIHQNGTAAVKYVDNSTNANVSTYIVDVNSRTPVLTVNITQGTSFKGTDRVLTLCEVEIYGDTSCNKYAYGLFCHLYCNCNKTDRCNVVTGACAPGCPPGYYGYNCVSRCGENCLHGICEWDKGECLQCNPGYKGHNCSEACDAGWFGENCMFPCRCRLFSSCEITSGECQGNDSCKEGYFGPGCQFVDLVHWYSVSNNPAYLHDSNDTTCNPDPNAVSVQLIHNTTYPFSWFRIVVNNKRNLLNFTTTLNDGHPCSNERKFQVSDTIVDVTCDITVNFENLRLKGAIVGSICSVYINGGRNVALRQQTSQSTTLFLSSSSKAVDGNTTQDIKFTHCSSTRIQSSLAWWHLTFNRPHILNYVRIFNRDVVQERLRGFELQTITQNGTVVVQYVDTSNTSLSTYNFRVYSPTPVTSVNMTQMTGVSYGNSSLTLCEVEIYGDNTCSNATYGLYCQHFCKCSKSDRCHVVTGACSSGCPAGYYGFNCLFQCSVNCLDDVCEWATGKCLRCKPGYIGGLCKRVCGKTFYGSNCVRCPENCLNRICHQTTGFCKLCKPGYRGNKCQYGSKPSIVLITILIIFFFSIIFMFFMRSKLRVITDKFGEE